ncbi:prolyl 4-hydroxylase [Trinickia symbiotica]|uniref:2-oxoglutarate-dependent dioxygenase n=1 Tax=Trinickia symbiotica TaxID=863227 RepID=A0A2N7X686_9BURK|nr:2OG-Fe(II) oxygenase [Trinickia symbiotica]PMS37263.1 2-oxoglutarate-dependent dioxygenase [Trinickia symbiotica]PPK42657.1 prolyl 4-hydroxylase [Trinickia symbiotica]
MAVLDETWKNWLTLNKNRGCTPESMIEAMMQAGFDPNAANAAVHRLMDLHGREDHTDSLPAELVSAEYQYDPSPVGSGNVVRASDRDVKVLMRCKRPQLMTFADLLADDECEELIVRSRDRLRPSTTVNPTTGTFDVIPNRSSKGICFQRGEDAFISRIEQRFASLMNWPVENGEGLQVLRYGIGDEYRPHFDYFPPGQAGSNVHLAHGGQRVATLIVYLNDVEAGGETIFPEVGLSVAPRRGCAVYFRYANGSRQVDPTTLHGGAPVIAGEKWIMTKWVRERAYV